MSNLKVWLFISIAVGVATYHYAPPHFWPLLQAFLIGEAAVALIHYTTH